MSKTLVASQIERCSPPWTWWIKMTLIYVVDILIWSISIFGGDILQRIVMSKFEIMGCGMWFGWYWRCTHCCLIRMAASCSLLLDVLDDLMMAERMTCLNHFCHHPLYIAICKEMLPLGQSLPFLCSGGKCLYIYCLKGQLMILNTGCQRECLCGVSV